MKLDRIIYNVAHLSPFSPVVSGRDWIEWNRKVYILMIEGSDLNEKQRKPGARATHPGRNPLASSHLKWNITLGATQSKVHIVLYDHGFLHFHLYINYEWYYTSLEISWFKLRQWSIHYVLWTHWTFFLNNNLYSIVLDVEIY